MLKKFLFVTILLMFVVSTYGQITITIDNKDDGFELLGDWTFNENISYFEGSAYFKPKGDGSATATWEQPLTHPGTYKIEIFNIDYKFAKDAQWTVRTTTGDSLILVDMYENPGWLELGEFDLRDTVSVQLSDYFESDTGNYVYADAVRLTSTMPLYQLSATVNLTGTNQNTDTEVKLFYSGKNDLIRDVISTYKNRQMDFTDLPAGNYRLEAEATGYSPLIVDNIEITNEDQAVDLNLEETDDPLYSITGEIQMRDEKSDTWCKTILYAGESLVAIDSVMHDNEFEFSSIPYGNYTIQYIAEGYANESIDVRVRTSDVTVDPMLLYPEFKFAWITDTHVGIHFTDPYYQKILTDIKNCDKDLDFILHSGDLTEHGYNSQLKTAYNYLEQTELPYYVSIGNHDTKWSESGLTRYKELFGELYYSFDHKGFHFINLNNAITLRGAGGYFNPAQIEWLKNDLAAMEDPNTPVIVMYHIPSSRDAVPNHWEITNILKDYRIVMIFTGHGHNNRLYDFDGLPGVMGMDTYNTGRPSGFNMISVSEKEVTFTPFYNESGWGDPWYTKETPDTIGTRMNFANIEMGTTLTEPADLEIELTENATGGSYLISPDQKAGSMSGSGKSWSLTIDPAELDNGYHEIKVTMMIDGGDAIHKYFSFYTETGDYPKALWRFDAEDEILSKPAYDGESVYIGTGQGKVYALNGETGDVVWNKQDTDGAVYSSPTVEDDVLYIGTNEGTLYALHTSDGSVKWSYNHDKSIQSGIILKDSLVYSGAGNDLIAVNKETGDLAWSYSTNGVIESRPAISGDKIVCTSWDTKVYCLDRHTGSRKWSWGYQSSMYYSPGAGWPVIMNDLIFIVDPSKQMTCLNLNSGTVEWTSTKTQVWDSIGKNEKNTQVYVRSLDGKLYAFAPSEEREVLWSAPAQFGFDAKPSMPFGKQGAVFAGGSSGNVVAVRQTTGEVKWIYHTAHTLVNSVTPKDGVSAFMTCLDGTVAYITGDPALDVETGKVPEYENLLLPAYPNPFNNVTTIRYTLKNPQKVSIHVYDILGKEIMKKDKVHNTPGQHQFTWNAVNRGRENLASGLYIVRLEGDGFTDQKKMLFLK